jgi:hypothetical protein
MFVACLFMSSSREETKSPLCVQSLHQVSNNYFNLFVFLCFVFFFFFCIIICEVAKFEANVNIGPTICRDEIQRIKAGNPDISHREAFSAAAKNVRSMRFFLGFLATLPN